METGKGQDSKLNVTDSELYPTISLNKVGNPVMEMALLMLPGIIMLFVFHNLRHDNYGISKYSVANFSSFKKTVLNVVEKKPTG